MGYLISHVTLLSFMAKKYSKRKLNWFLRYYKKLSKKELSSVMKIHIKSVPRLYKKLVKKGVDNCYSDKGRPKKQRSPEWKQLISEIYEEQRCGAKIMEKIIDKHYKIHIPHNYIHETLLTHEMAKEDKKKQKQRTYKSYERKHSNSAWHTDYKWIESKQKWLIAYIDDHSRFITAYGMFDNATTENALILLKIAIVLYGQPREIITDKGSQFYANRKDNEGNKGLSDFEAELKKLGINLITGRRNHPQTNGKIERWFKTWIEHHWRFKSLEEFVFWYNCKRYHSSIDYETPMKVFYRDFRKLLLR